MCTSWTDYVNSGQVLSSPASERTLERSYTEENLTCGLLHTRQSAASHGLWRTRFNFHSDIVWFVCVCVCVGRWPCLHILTSFSGFWNREANHMWLRRMERSVLEKNKLSCDGMTFWWNDWRSWKATKQRREERQTHKKGKIKTDGVHLMCPRGAMIYTHFPSVSRRILDLWRLAGPDGLRRVTWHTGYNDGHRNERILLAELLMSHNNAGLQAFLSSNYAMILEWKTSERPLKVQKTLLSVVVRLYRWETEFSSLNCEHCVHYIFVMGFTF